METSLFRPFDISFKEHRFCFDNNAASPATISGTVTVDSEFNAAAALADAAAANVTTPTVGSVGLVMNATTLDRQRASINAANTTGTGIAAAGLMAQFDDTSPTTVTENQFGNVRMSANGVLYAGGGAATNVAVNSNPINLGAQAVSSENTAVTTARMVQLVADLAGKLIVLPYANPENFVSGAITSAMTGTTTTSLLAAPAAGLRNYITQITVSSGSITVPTDIIIQDGSGGTTLYTLPCPIGTGTGTGTAGGTYVFPTPLRQPTTATAIFCANVTTGSSTKVSATGYKGA